MAFISLAEWARDLFYPIGVYVWSNSSPASSIGGTWQQISAGTFLCAAGAGYAVNSTGGTASTLLSVDQIPRSFWSSWGEGNNLKTLFSPGSNYGISCTPEDKMSKEAHENRPPYRATNLWYRTA